MLGLLLNSKMAKEVKLNMSINPKNGWSRIKSAMRKVAHLRDNEETVSVEFLPVRHAKSICKSFTMYQ